MIGRSIKAVDGWRGNASVHASPRMLMRWAWRFAGLWRRSMTLPTRLVMTVALAFAVISGASAPCVAAEFPITSGALVHNAQFEMSQGVEAQMPDPSDPESKGKSNPFGLCSAHCAAHVFSIWTPLSTPFAPTMTRLSWAASVPQWTEVSRPSGLERPPRV